MSAVVTIPDVMHQDLITLYSFRYEVTSLCSSLEHAVISPCCHHLQNMILVVSLQYRSLPLASIHSWTWYLTHWYRKTEKCITEVVSRWVKLYWVPGEPPTRERLQMVWEVFQLYHYCLLGHQRIHQRHDSLGNLASLILVLLISLFSSYYISNKAKHIP